MRSTPPRPRCSIGSWPSRSPTRNCRRSRSRSSTTRKSSGRRGSASRIAAKTIPATAETVYRVGSVSKLFTDVAVMQLVEAGQARPRRTGREVHSRSSSPHTRPGEKPITLRMLMSHRSGLIREPPVGNYFDPTEPSLEKTVASLNGIELVYPPGERDEVFERRRSASSATRCRRSQREKLRDVRAAHACSTCSA